ncbi:sugar ABC transporter permease [Phytohabitans sp. ZYX-F-186]|uniref:Sugar ABC transporter permease n=1 Tax=Phytohabitans maris TaxID=3071409 RepID=A0ABU0ZP17_9ACTN|nr:sugar ABC transporter permease [Phytohabitans sp. ZYX-F-186]MDQ7908755.1 sugar ABC transporter permease [Phytohabitans sp. ZYX-F-186]
MSASPLRANVQWASYAMVAPAYVLMAIFAVVPTLLVFALAFFNYDPLAGTITWAGVDNFVAAGESGEATNATLNTLLYAVLTVPVTLIAGLLAALAMNRLGRGSTLWRSVYFLPSAATLAAMAVVWQWLYYPDSGLVDRTFGQVTGVRAWLESDTWAMPAMAVIGSWQAIGMATIILLAGLASVPRHLYEAAFLDGAGPFATFRTVTLPALTPTLLFVTVLTTRNALSVFDQIKVITQGGPDTATETLAFALFRRGITYLDIGGASVLTMILLILTLAVVSAQFVLTQRRVNVEGRK